ncbi:MAG: EVE domain-containing protein [Candidatus Eisenbacteria bacterium]|nr:EVE domain-containing protein [Candidatus Eisenbacteria bacterium]
MARYWLMKSEPDVFGIADLEKKGHGVWEGVRNYQARNYLREMAEGDLALFYHSNAKPSGVAGILRIVRTAYPDPFQFDRKSEYHDPKSKKEDPRWSAVDVGFVERFADVVTLDQMKSDPALAGMRVLERGTRLSVTPVEPEHFAHVLDLAHATFTIRNAANAG